MIVIRDIIESIALSFQSSGSVSSFVDNTGSYTITTSSTGNLETGFKVKLIYSDTSLNRDVILTAKTATTFTFDGTGITEPDSWEMALYFEVGHRLELEKKYLNAGKSTNKKIQNYPLIWLYTDFDKKKGNNEMINFSTSLSGAVVDFSQKDKYEEQRIEDKFKPILYPILTLFENAFNNKTYKRYFVGLGKINIDSTDRPFFGSADQKQNVLPQVTDAIEWTVELDWHNEDQTCQQVYAGL